MSQVLIQQYFNQLQDLRKVSGTHREMVVREAFKDLLKGWARSHDLIFVPEYEIATHWAEWGKELMDLHIGYESVAPAKLKRIDRPDDKAHEAGLSPKCILKADKDGGRIIIDTETSLTGIPPVGITDLVTDLLSSGFSTSTKKRNPKTRRSARSSIPTASRTTKRK